MGQQESIESLESGGVMTPPTDARKLDASIGNRYRCTLCGCFWRKHENGSWSLWNAAIKPCKVCDNSPEFLNVIEQVDDLHNFLTHAEKHGLLNDEQIARCCAKAIRNLKAKP